MTASAPIRRAWLSLSSLPAVAMTPRADGLGDLHGEATDAAAGGHYQHRFPWAHAGTVDQHLIRRQPRRGQRSGLVVRTIVREMKGTLGGRHGVFRVTAGAAGDDAVADLEALHLGAELDHLAGEVPPQNMRRADAGAVRPFPHEDVQAVQRRGGDADEHVVRPRPRRRQVAVDQHFRRTRFFDVDGFHDACLLPGHSGRTGTR